MNTITAPRITRPQPRPRPIRPRLEAATLHPTARLLTPTAAENDFLVSNPRPDLTLDPRTLRMFEAG